MAENQPVILGVIPARGGSKRVPKKNIKMLGGKPLIGWTIEEAKKAKSLSHFIVSTDDADIKKISRAFNASVPFMRPADISEDVDTSWVLMHAVEWWERYRKEQVDYIVCLQPTSPFRSADDIDNCVRIALEKPDADTVVSVTKAREHPYWCFEMGANQKLTSFLNIELKGDVLVSQNLPLALFPNGAVYVTKRDVIMNGRIYGQNMYPYLMSRPRSLDLEEELDFFVASAMLEAYGKDKTTWLQYSWKVS